MRWQRAADELLRRFGDATSHWGADGLTELASVVVPVLVVGDDRTDYERRTFTDGSELTTAAGRIAEFSVDATAGAVELLAFGIGRPSSANPVGYARIDANASATPQGGSNGGFSSSAVLSAALPMVMRSPAGETLWLPVRGIVLERGQRFAVATAELAVTAFAWAAWRNVGPAS